MKKLYTVSKNKTKSWLWLGSCFSWENSGLKKAGKTTRPARYDLTQIPYEYAVEVTNRFKWLDLVDTVPEELCMEAHNPVQEAANQTIPKKKKNKKVKWLSEEALQIAEERSEKQGRKGKVHPAKCRVPKNSKERQEGLLQWTVHKTRRKQKKEKAQRSMQ